MNGEYDDTYNDGDILNEVVTNGELTEGFSYAEAPYLSRNNDGYNDDGEAVYEEVQRGFRVFGTIDELQNGFRRFGTTDELQDGFKKLGTMDELQDGFRMLGTIDG